MKIVPLHDPSQLHLFYRAQTGQDGGPTAAELNAIERDEMPLIRAEVELLDVQISVLDRPRTAFDERRLRRAANKVLVARRALINQSAAVRTGDAA